MDVELDALLFRLKPKHVQALLGQSHEIEVAFVQFDAICFYLRQIEQIVGKIEDVMSVFEYDLDFFLAVGAQRWVGFDILQIVDHAVEG